MFGPDSATLTGFIQRVTLREKEGWEAEVLIDGNPPILPESGMEITLPGGHRGYVTRVIDEVDWIDAVGRPGRRRAEITVRESA